MTLIMHDPKWITNHPQLNENNLCNVLQMLSMINTKESHTIMASILYSKPELLKVRHFGAIY